MYWMELKIKRLSVELMDLDLHIQTDQATVQRILEALVEKKDG